MPCRRLAVVAAILGLLNGRAVAAPPAAGATCDRACLDGAIDRYLEAMVAHDPARAPLATSVKYTENQTLLPIGDGLWKDAESVSSYKIYATDVGAGQVGFMGAVKAAAGWTMIALRLKVVDRRITEVEAILPGRAPIANSAMAEAPAKLTKPRGYFSRTVPASSRRDRFTMINIADSHYEAIERGNGDIVPFTDDCIKIENGVQLIKNPDFPFPAASPSGRKLPNFAAMGCREQFNTHIWDMDTITDRRYPIVDQERGIVMAFVMYHQYIKGPCATVVDHGPVCPPTPVEPFSLVLAEAFKIADAELHGVEAVFTVLPTIRQRGVW